MSAFAIQGNARITCLSAFTLAVVGPEDIDAAVEHISSIPDDLDRMRESHGLIRAMLKAVVELTHIRAVSARALRARPVPAGEKRWTYERIARDLGIGDRNPKQRGAGVVNGSRSELDD